MATFMMCVAMDTDDKGNVFAGMVQNILKIKVM